MCIRDRFCTCSILIPPFCLFSTVSIVCLLYTSGYRTAFYLRTVEKEREELEALAGTRERPCVVPALSPWEIREISMSQQTGIQWGRQMVEYAFAVNSLYGGGRVCTADGYALYRRQGDLAEILEWRCLGDMGACLLYTSCSRYSLAFIRVSPFFHSNGWLRFSFNIFSTTN